MTTSIGNVGPREGAFLLVGLAIGLLLRRDGLLAAFWRRRKRRQALAYTRPLRRHSWDDFCLVLVHLQRDQYSARSSVAASSPFLGQNIVTLAEICRAKGIEVVHLRDGSCVRSSAWYAFWQRMNPTADACCDPSAPEDFAAERPGERVFVSQGYDGVNGNSGLEPYLRSRGRSVAFVCGLTTSCSVHANALGLFLRGYETFVVGDCCGDLTAKMHRGTLQRENRRSYAVCNLEGVEALLLSNDPRYDLLAGGKHVAANTTQFESPPRPVKHKPGATVVLLQRRTTVGNFCLPPTAADV